MVVACGNQPFAILEHLNQKRGLIPSILSFLLEVIPNYMITQEGQFQEEPGPFPHLARFLI